LISKTFRVAAIQPICKPGPVVGNLSHIAELIEKAAADNAELVLLPERFPEAFRFNETAWLAESPARGRWSNG